MELEGTTTWTWGAASHNTPTAKYIGRLKSISTSAGYGELNTYDSLGRIAQQSVIIDAVPYQINRTYSATTGWPATLQYPTSTSGYRLQLAYDYQNGYLKRVRNASSGTVYWEAVSADAAGRLQNETFGNGVQTYTEYDQANGWLFKRQAGVGGGTGLIDAQVSWDYNGNFTTRQDQKQGLTETFVYDAMNRLDYSQRNGVTNLDVTLDAIGNVTWKSDVGSYSYHATKRRAVVAAGSNSYGYDANGNMTTRNGSTVSYASYNLPTSIASGANSSTLTYGAWRNRIKQVAVTSGSTETTVYVAGLVEKVTKGSTVEYRHQIEATPGTVAVYVRKSSASNIMYYLHRDHLGSPEMITNSSGTSLVKLSFSAYGERRDVDWDGPVSSTHLATAANTTRHGFTDHEHLDSVKLIHMGGRVYDPLIGRFLSRDPYIDGVDSSQGANGYGYVHNNPLSLWDPTGYTAEELEEILVTGRRSRWRSVYLDEIARFLSQPFAGNAQGGGGAGGANGATTPPAEPKEGGKEEPQGDPCPTGALNDLPGYGLGPQQYDEAQTAKFLAAARAQDLSDMFGNHWPNGTFDFSYNARYGDTFSVNGFTYNSSQFGNFLAGYSGAFHYGFAGYSGVVVAGFADNLWDNGFRTDGDAGSRPYIRDGAAQGESDRQRCESSGKRNP